ncbi:MAG: hypothetical protein U1F12_11165 [Pseudomonadales bacterium]
MLWISIQIATDSWLWEVLLCQLIFSLGVGWYSYMSLFSPRAKEERHEEERHEEERHEAEQHSNDQSWTPVAVVAMTPIAAYMGITKGQLLILLLAGSAMVIVVIILTFWLKRR